jgi:hypothetical protein
MLNNWIKPYQSTRPLENGSIKIVSNSNQNPVEKINENSLVFLSAGGKRSSLVKDSLAEFQNYFEELEIIDLGFFQKEDATFNTQLFQDFKHGKITSLILDKDLVWFSEIMHGLKTINPKTRNICISNKIYFSEFGIPTDFIGFQRHLVPLMHLQRIHDYSINSMSLGKLRADSDLLEPIMRDAQNVYFDIGAIRKSDAPGSYDSMSSGLTCEEACQIFKYLGGNAMLNNVVIGGNFECDDLTALCIAELIWYFFEGRSSIIHDHPSIDQNYKEYLVEIESLKDTFSFIKNDRSGRWWFKINENEDYVSCSRNEYQQASNDELPDRLLKHYTSL